MIVYIYCIHASLTNFMFSAICCSLCSALGGVLQQRNEQMLQIYYFFPIELAIKHFPAHHCLGFLESGFWEDENIPIERKEKIPVFLKVSSISGTVVTTAQFYWVKQSQVSSDSTLSWQRGNESMVATLETRYHSRAIYIHFFPISPSP